MGSADLSKPLIASPPESSLSPEKDLAADDDQNKLSFRVWVESKKLWHIVGPAIFSRITTYSMNVVAQAFAGHLGDVELAAFSIANNVIVGFSFGFMLGMASALETLCGQAFGAKRHHMLGIYMQRSWIVLFLCCVLLLPLYIFATPILKLLGQEDSVADLSGEVCLWLISQHFSFAFQFPLNRFLQSQLKTGITAYVSALGFVVHVTLSYLLVYQVQWGLLGLSIAINASWWSLVLGLYGYTAWGGCPMSWTGFSMQAFSGLWEFLKLSASSGVMLCVEHWYYKILMLMTGTMIDAQIAIDALSVCMTINGWEMMIPLAFFAAAGVRVANELGSGNGKGAKFATNVAVTASTIIGLFFCALIMILHNKFALIFTTSQEVLKAVDNMAYLLAITILLNSVQPVLSGVAVGSGWQSLVAYINLGCYYVVGLPLGMILGWVLDWGVEGIWGGMILGGTAVQTAILAIITIRCNWDAEAQKASKHVEQWSTDQA